jgi:hypothetical protein
MPALDSACHLSIDQSIVNFISVTTVDKYDFNLVRERAKRFLIEKKKLRMHIVEIFGDLYWADTTRGIEAELDRCLLKVPEEIKDERDLEKFINKEINKPIPMDQP